MTLDHPPIPVKRNQEFSFPSKVFADITYILKPYSQANVAGTIITQRMIAAQRRPLTEQMHAMIVAADLTPYLSQADLSRCYETINALVAGALGIPEEDLVFIDRVVEPIMIRHFPDYYKLAKADETLAYERRMRDLADLLYAVEDKGERYTFPTEDSNSKYEYVREYMDTLDINLLFVESYNLQRLSDDTAKNSEAPSTSA